MKIVTSIQIYIRHDKRAKEKAREIKRGKEREITKRNTHKEIHIKRI